MEIDNAPPGKGARMADVARLAGVSQQTVSRVVNGSPNVAPEIRSRVENAIDKLRYRRNPAARALATAKSMNIGIISFGLAQYGPSVALTGIAEEARRSGYATNVVTLDAVSRNAVRAALDHLMADSVDGIVVLAPIHSAVLAVESMDSLVPLVVFEPGSATAPHRVVTDEAEGARLATEHLLELGHELVHHVAGPDGWLGTEARIRGWRAAMGSAGRRTPDVIVGDWTAASGARIGNRLADDLDVTAVFVANDQMALGILSALHDRGLRVPEDISVVGFDDIPEAAYFRPSLTTVQFDFGAVGRLAVERILSFMRGEGGEPIPLIPPRFVERASSGPPPLRLRSTLRDVRSHVVPTYRTGQ